MGTPVGPSGEATPSSRILIAIGALFAGLVLSAFIGAIVIGAGGWDLDVSSADGADFGRVAGQYGVGAPLDHNRIPLVVLVALNIPLWAGFVGVPLWARRRGLDWRRHLGWAFRWVDVPVGLVTGVLVQTVAVPLLYWPILHWVDNADLEAPARDLVAGATSPVAVVALVAFTVVVAPVVEEILYRGLLFRAILDMEAGSRAAVPVAVLASAVIFGVSHLQLLQLPGLVLIGAVAAVAFWRTGRLSTAIFVHVGFNLTTVALLLPST